MMPMPVETPRSFAASQLVLGAQGCVQHTGHIQFAIQGSVKNAFGP